MESARRICFALLLASLPGAVGCSDGNPPGDNAPQPPAPAVAEPASAEPVTDESLADEPGRQTTADDVKREAGEAFDATSQYAREQAEELHRQLQQKVDELEPRIERLKAKAQDLKDQAKPEWNRRIAQLEEQRKVAQQKLDALKKASPEAWKELKSGASRAWTDLKQSYDSAARHFENAEDPESSQSPDEAPQK